VCSFRGADDNFYVLDASIDGFPVPLSSPSGSIGNDACKDVVSARTPVSPGRHDVRVSARLVDEHGRDLFGGDPYPANNSLNRIFRLR